MSFKSVIYKDWTYGVIDSVEQTAIPDTAASASLNWVTESTKIVLRRGYARLGTTNNDNTHPITGLITAQKVGLSGTTDVLFRKRGRKLEYYDTVTEDWLETGTDVFPVLAENDDVTMANYSSVSGAQLWIGSPNMHPLKVMTANPESATDMTDTAVNTTGYIAIKQNRMFQWDGKDKTGLRGGYIDKDEATDFTKMSAEPVGSLGSKTYTGILKMKSLVVTMTIATPAVVTSTAHGMLAGNSFTFSTTGALPTGVTAGTVYYVIAAGLTVDAFQFSTASGGSAVATSGTQSGVHTLSKINKRTCLEAVFTDTVETLTDNFDGTLTGSAGGTGTINYTTGAYSITFNANAVGAVTATYRWEDANASGVSDFTKSTPRTAGQGFVFRQDDGGGIFRNLMSIGGTEYCFHDTKTWALTISIDDTDATNLIYRDRVGLPFFRGACETGDGIYYVDNTDQNDPHLRLLSFDMGGSEVIPKSVSKRLKMNNERIGKSFKGYRFDKTALIEWGDFIVFTCRTEDSTPNNRVFTYNKQTGAIDEHDYFVSCFAIYDGSLIGGDSVTGNVYVLFSGHDDDGSNVSNYWEGKLNDFGISRLKKQKKVVVQGEIGPDQQIDIYIAIDRGSYTLVGSVSGDGTYVDKAQGVSVGRLTVGNGEVGGGGGEIQAYNYMREFKLAIDKFQLIKLKFEATQLGYASVSTVEMKDVREKFVKLPTKYR